MDPLTAQRKLSVPHTTTARRKLSVPQPTHCTTRVVSSSSHLLYKAERVWLSPSFLNINKTKRPIPHHTAYGAAPSSRCLADASSAESYLSSLVKFTKRTVHPHLRRYSDGRGRLALSAYLANLVPPRVVHKHLPCAPGQTSKFTAPLHHNLTSWSPPGGPLSIIE